MFLTDTKSLIAKSLCAFWIVLFPPTLSSGQNESASSDADYTTRLVRLLTGLQKNPWMGWKAGSEVRLRYFVERDEAGKSLGVEQPDWVFRIVEADQRFEITQTVKGKPVTREFLVANEPGIQKAHSGLKGSAKILFEIDGVNVECVVKELTLTTFPGGTSITREWILADHPTILLRQDFNDNRWTVTSARATRTIGSEQFACGEFKDWMRFYSDGPAEVVTTQYRCPDVPGHLVEKRIEFFRIRKGVREYKPFQVVHQKVIEIKRIS